MCIKFCENPFSGSGDILMFICDRLTDRQTDKQTDRLTDRQTNRRTPDYHIHMGETFYLIEKLPPLLTTQISLRSFTPFAGG